MSRTELIAFANERLAKIISIVRPKKAKGLWSMWRVDEEDPKKLKELAASAGRLRSLMEHVGWKDVSECKAFYLADMDAMTKNVGADDKTRLVAAAQWTAVEGFFKELKLRIKAGDEAAKVMHEEKRKSES